MLRCRILASLDSLLGLPLGGQPGLLPLQVDRDTAQPFVTRIVALSSLFRLFWADLRGLRNFLRPCEREFAFQI